jgi:hypothetical protein
MAECHLCSGHVERFWLVKKLYKLCRVRNPFEWLCPRYRTGYGVILTRRVWSMMIWVLSYAYDYYGYLSIFLRLLSLYHLSLPYFIDRDITYFLVTFLPGERGGTYWVRLYPSICCCVFSSRSRCSRGSSRRRPHPSRAVKVSCLSRVVL